MQRLMKVPWEWKFQRWHLTKHYVNKKLFFVILVATCKPIGFLVD